MQNGKINFKLKGGLNVLCVVLAGKLVIDTLIKLDDWASRDQQRKGLKEAAEAMEKINNMLDHVKVKETEEEVKTEES